MNRSCPQCKKTVAPKAENEAFPFCCKHCQDMDLGQWFDGKYVVSSPVMDPDLFGLPTESDED